jgi:hypothetical protein
MKSPLEATTFSSLGRNQEAAAGPLGGLPGDVAEDLHVGGDKGLYFVRGSVITSPRYATL